MKRFLDYKYKPQNEPESRNFWLGGRLVASNYLITAFIFEFWFRSWNLEIDVESLKIVRYYIYGIKNHTCQETCTRQSFERIKVSPDASHNFCFYYYFLMQWKPMEKLGLALYYHRQMERVMKLFIHQKIWVIMYSRYSLFRSSHEVNISMEWIYFINCSF